MVEEVKKELTENIIPFWEKLKDTENGGYYGYVGYDLTVDKKAVKGGILNSRILWFFSNAYLVLKDKRYLKDAEIAYRFIRDDFWDKENGGIYWSLTYDGKPEEAMKHTYNQAFAIYGLSSYYDASKDEDSLKMAQKLFTIIETKCRDKDGYLEAFNRDFSPAENEKLSENGVMAERTMNTLLHIFEAYTELYRVSKDEEVKAKMLDIIDIFINKVYNPQKHRLEVFFDRDYNSLIDLYSYGHDIEAAWLLDLGAQIIGDESVIKKVDKLTTALTEEVYKSGFDGKSLPQESENGIVNEDRVWWVQAETVNGFLNGYRKDAKNTIYKDAYLSEWKYIQDKIIDKRVGSEWFWKLNKNGAPDQNKPIVEPWKCPYHNGRMCFEVIRRTENAS